MENSIDRLTSIGLRFSTKKLLDTVRVGDESYNSVLKRILSRGEMKWTEKEKSDASYPREK